jgi:hypothetical protein
LFESGPGSGLFEIVGEWDTGKAENLLFDQFVYEEPIEDNLHPTTLRAMIDEIGLETINVALADPGSAVLNGIVLEVGALPGALPGVYDLMSAAGPITYTGVTEVALGGVEYTTQIVGAKGGETLQLVVTAIPEPGTGVMLITGAIVLWLSLRCRRRRVDG